MPAINFIAAMQSSIPATTGKSAAQQIAATSSQPKANASSSVTIPHSRSNCYIAVLAKLPNKIAGHY